MGYKSRGNYSIGLCIRPCSVRGEKCKDCINFDEYVRAKKGNVRFGYEEVDNYGT